MSNNPIPLGAVVEDILTRFKGVATKRVEHMTGCTQYEVVTLFSKKHNAQIANVDEARVTILEMPKTQAQDEDPKPIPFGTKAKDKVTGFEGIVISRFIPYAGSERYMLMGASRKGKPGLAAVIDRGELEILKEGEVELEPHDVQTKDRPGGPEAPFIEGDWEKGLSL